MLDRDFFLLHKRGHVGHFLRHPVIGHALANGCQALQRSASQRQSRLLGFLFHLIDETSDQDIIVFEEISSIFFVDRFIAIVQIELIELFEAGVPVTGNRVNFAGRLDERAKERDLGCPRITDIAALEVREMFFAFGELADAKIILCKPPQIIRWWWLDSPVQGDTHACNQQ